MEHNFIGKRIRYFRKKAGMTMHELGEKLGFNGSTADVRICQYETGYRVPKKIIVNQLADEFHVSPEALLPPDYDTVPGFMHQLFFLEERYGLTLVSLSGTDVGLSLTPKTNDKEFNRQVSAATLFWMIARWMLESDIISDDTYQYWKDNYPHVDLFQYIPGFESAVRRAFDINSGIALDTVFDTTDKGMYGTDCKLSEPE